MVGGLTASYVNDHKAKDKTVIIPHFLFLGKLQCDFKNSMHGSSLYHSHSHTFYNTAALSEALYSLWQGNDVRMGCSNTRLLCEPYFGKETKGSLG